MVLTCFTGDCGSGGGDDLTDVTLILGGVRAADVRMAVDGTKRETTTGVGYTFLRKLEFADALTLATSQEPHSERVDEREHSGGQMAKNVRTQRERNAMWSSSQGAATDAEMQNPQIHTPLDESRLSSLTRVQGALL